MRMMSMTQWRERWEDELSEDWNEYEGDMDWPEFCNDAYDYYVDSFYDLI